MNVDVDLSPLSVLIIDDSRYARSFLRSALYAFGVRTIVEAADGPEGIAILRERKIDLIVVDHDMVPMDGIAFTRFIRSGEPVPCFDVPIVMVSGAAEMEAVIEARNCGVNEFLVKPVSANALYRRVRNVVLNPRPFVDGNGYRGPCRRTIDRAPAADRRETPPLPRPPPLLRPVAEARAAAAAKAPSPPGQRTSRRRFRGGAVIFNEGDNGDQAYVVESGSVAIYKEVDGRPVVLGMLGKGGIFGEMALIDDEPRMASAAAEEDTVCMILPKEAIKSQVGRSPELVILVLDTLLANIRTMGRELVEARAALRVRRGEDWD